MTATRERRGPSGGPDLLERESAYLKRIVFLVSQLHPEKHLGQSMTDAQVEKVKKQLESEYPGFGITYFLYGGIPAEWKRQQNTRAK